MASIKMEIPVFQQADNLRSKFQWIYPCFRFLATETNENGATGVRENGATRTSENVAIGARENAERPNQKG